MRKPILRCILYLLAAFYILPVIITAVKAFTYNKNFPTLNQFTELLTTNYTALRFFWNSVAYATVTTLVCVAVSLPLGFLFGKIRFPFRDGLFFIYIVVMLLPFQATLLPNYIELRDLGLLDTPLALTLSMIFSPFAVFLLRQFITLIPSEQIEYAMLETSSPLKLMRYAVIPQVRSAIICVSVLIFCESWNMVEPAMIFAANNKEIQPFSITLTQLPEDTVYAGAMVYMYPILIIFALFGETIEKALYKYKW